MFKRHRSGSGFTLVELLVVIGIIAVLVAILLPSLNKARHTANTVKGLANLQQIGIGLRLYAGMNKDSLPPGGVKYANNDVAYWYHFVNAAMGAPGDSTASTPPDTLSKVFVDPNGIGGNHVYYSCHPVAMPDYTQFSYPLGAPNPSAYPKPYQLAKITSEQPIIFDAAQLPDLGFEVYPVTLNLDDTQFYPGYWDWTQQVNWYLDPADSNPALPNNGKIVPGMNKDDNDCYGMIRWRQVDSEPQSALGGANMLFGDGHAETRRQGDVKRYMILMTKR